MKYNSGIAHSSIVFAAGYSKANYAGYQISLLFYASCDSIVVVVVASNEASNSQREREREMKRKREREREYPERATAMLLP